MRFDDIKLDVFKNSAKRISTGEGFGLTSTEFALLNALADSSNAILTWDRIMDVVYGNSVAATDRAIDAHVAQLRRKLMGSDQEPSIILTVHGTG